MQNNLIIYSVLARKDAERLSHTINILSHLSRLENVIVQSGMKNLLIEIQSALMNKRLIVCLMKNRCLISSYLTISSKARKPPLLQVTTLMNKVKKVLGITRVKRLWKKVAVIH